MTKMTNQDKMMLFSGAALFIMLLAGAIIFTMDNNSNEVLAEESSYKQQDEYYTKTELANYDGKDGRDCYIALNKKVYSVNENILSFMEFSNSNAETKCGEDLTDNVVSTEQASQLVSDYNEIGILQF